MIVVVSKIRLYILKGHLFFCKHFFHSTTFWNCYLNLIDHFRPAFLNSHIQWKIPLSPRKANKDIHNQKKMREEKCDSFSTIVTLASGLFTAHPTELIQENL